MSLLSGISQSPIRTLEHRHTKSRVNDYPKKEGMKAYKDRKESKMERQNEDIKERMIKDRA